VGSTSGFRPQTSVVTISQSCYNAPTLEAPLAWSLLLTPLFFLTLSAATLVIIYICVVWMRSTRASQKRMEELQERTNELLEEQIELLRRIAEK
jgi:membrane protein implicated in regulation of membrane protease activity